MLVDDDLAAREHGVDVAVDLEALPGGVVHVHVVGLAVADRGVAVRVVDDDVGVGAGLDDALLAVQAEHARRGGRGELDPALERDLAGRRRPGTCRSMRCSIRADAVRDLAEVAEPELLLAPSCRTGSGRSRPSAGRWCAAPATCGPGGPPPASAAASSTPTWRPRSAPLLARCAELLLEREVEVLRAGLAEHVLALVAGRGELLDGLLGAARARRRAARR